MTYVAEIISTADRHKILADAAAEPLLSARFSAWNLFGSSEQRMRWAIDRRSANYLFRSPTFAREIDNEYHFRFDGTFYVLAVWTLREPSVVYSWDYATPLSVRPSGFESEVLEAFRVYAGDGAWVTSPVFPTAQEPRD